MVKGKTEGKGEKQKQEVLNFNVSEITRKDIQWDRNAYYTTLCICESEKPFSEVIFSKSYASKEWGCDEMEEDFLECFKEEFEEGEGK